MSSITARVPSGGPVQAPDHLDGAAPATGDLQAGGEAPLGHAQADPAEGS